MEAAQHKLAPIADPSAVKLESSWSQVAPPYLQRRVRCRSVGEIHVVFGLQLDAKAEMADGGFEALLLRMGTDG